MERVREALVQSLTRGAGRISSELGISSRSVKQKLHESLQFHPINDHWAIVEIHKLRTTDYLRKSDESNF